MKRCSAITALNMVATTPGPNPPSTAATKTAGYSVIKGKALPIHGPSMDRAATPRATAATAQTYGRVARATDGGSEGEATGDTRSRIGSGWEARRADK